MTIRIVMKAEFGETAIGLLVIWNLDWPVLCPASGPKPVWLATMHWY